MTRDVGAAQTEHGGADESEQADADRGEEGLSQTTLLNYVSFAVHLRVGRNGSCLEWAAFGGPAPSERSTWRWDAGATRA